MTDPGCYFHGDEPIPPDCFRVCGECGHAFTAAELLTEHNRVVAWLEWISEQERVKAPTWDRSGQWIGAAFPEAPRVPESDPDRVHVCPLCTHDF